MLEKFAKMSVREAMIELAGKPGYGEQERWLETVARAADITVRTARSLWRNEISEVHWAAEKVRREARIKQARRDAAALSDQYTTIIGGLRARDENFYSAEIARLERLIRIIGHLDRT